MSFCFLYNVVSENYSVQNSPWGGGGGGGGSIASSRSIRCISKIVSRNVLCFSRCYKSYLVLFQLPSLQAARELDWIGTVKGVRLRKQKAHQVMMTRMMTPLFQTPYTTKLRNKQVRFSKITLFWNSIFAL